MCLFVGELNMFLSTFNSLISTALCVRVFSDKKSHTQGRLHSWGKYDINRQENRIPRMCETGVDGNSRIKISYQRTVGPD